MKQTWSAPERNKEPILEVLRRVLPADGRVVEIASGSGQHVVHFATNLPRLRFEPTDLDEANLASIAAYAAEAALPNLAPPRRLDVLEDEFARGEVDAVFCANMIHIAPWACALGLVRGAGRHLRDGGRLVVYGPFRIGGRPTSESNDAFDRDLRRRDPAFGVRDLEAFVAAADAEGLAFDERVAMPANNQTLVFTRRPRPRAL